MDLRQECLEKIEALKKQRLEAAVDPSEQEIVDYNEIVEDIVEYIGESFDYSRVYEQTLEMDTEEKAELVMKNQAQRLLIQQLMRRVSDDDMTLAMWEAKQHGVIEQAVGVIDEYEFCFNDGDIESAMAAIEEITEDLLN
jgi:hypothetical protein